MSTVASDIVSPLMSEQQLNSLNLAVSGLGANQLIWASGYLAGVAAGPVTGATQAALSSAAPVEATTAQEPVWSVLYATETGNSRRIAETLAAQASANGLSANALDLRDYKPARIKKESNVLIIAATHGLGEAPDGSEDFYDYLMSERAPRLSGLNYSVLALGDSSYDDYCKIGRDIDTRLQELGATRLAPRIDCDVDYEDDADHWTTSVLAYAREHASGDSERPAARLRAVPDTPRYSRANPFTAEVLVSQKITGRESDKTVQHLELSLEGAGIEYKPGDSLGVLPTNPRPLVDEILAALGLDDATPVILGDETLSLGQALTERLEITALSRGFVNAYAEKTANPALGEALAALEGDAARAYLVDNQIVDILHAHPGAIAAQDFVACLRKLTPRLYSIASSPGANPDEVHLTVAAVDYERYGRRHVGSASSFLLGASGNVPVYVESNDHFRLPENPDVPVVMIGPGTGVAPFRAFVQERAESDASGKNWLFFGARNFRSDFLYQTEMQRHLKDGVLTRLDVAFSRDQEHKIYVQDRIRENADELFRWIGEGAHIYVCGDAENMAKDVHEALLDVIVAGSDSTRQVAEEYLRDLKRQRRYQRDVY